LWWLSPALFPAGLEISENGRVGGRQGEPDENRLVDAHAGREVVILPRLSCHSLTGPMEPTVLKMGALR
jgi:hypothetical protein